MSRIIAKSEINYNEYQICARVYELPNRVSSFHVVALVKVDGHTHAIRRDTIQGLYWARKTMLDMLADIHGNY